MNLYKFNNKKYLYKSPKIPDINKTIIFADDTASGRPSPYIENQIVKHILPYYSNTHSNAYCGILMKEYIQKTRDYIRTTFNLKKYHKILFSGNGCTGAINHLCNSINYKKYNKVYIYITKDEHYSNYLPWYEISRHYDNVQVSIIKKADDLKNMTTCPKCLNIISINGCSNVTGKIRNLKPFINIKNKFENSYLLVDMAACAPYIKLDVSNLDGIYVSMHKFLGGVSTPGLLIVNEKIFNSDHPYCPGGGCVQKANTKEIIYETDLEKKESAGTPNIVGIIKIGYVLELKEYLLPLILNNEHQIVKYVYSQFEYLHNKYNIIVIGGTKERYDRLPIVSFSIPNVHYNFITILMNDLFGISTRGGISCCGILSEHYKNKYNVDGWCRISYSYMFDKKTIDYITKAVEYIILNHNKYINDYIYNSKTNLYMRK